MAEFRAVDPAVVIVLVMGAFEGVASKDSCPGRALLRCSGGNVLASVAVLGQIMNSSWGS